MSIFDQVQGASSTSTSGSYTTAGTYLCRFTRFLSDKERRTKDQRTNLFMEIVHEIAPPLVTESIQSLIDNAPSEAARSRLLSKCEGMGVGEPRRWGQTIREDFAKQDTSLVMQAFCAVLNITDKEFNANPAKYQEILTGDEGGKGAGLYFIIQGTPTKTNKGTIWIKNSFRPGVATAVELAEEGVISASAEDILGTCAALDIEPVGC